MARTARLKRRAEPFIIQQRELMCFCWTATPGCPLSALISLERQPGVAVPQSLRRRVGASLEDDSHLGLAARIGSEIGFVGLITAEGDAEVMFAGADQHGMKPAAEVAAVTHVTAVDKHSRAFWLDVDAQLLGIVAGVS